ncbi:hypothetical protein [Winogradskyella pulchriflava]|uniref:Lipocalin-like domain-containing protein n=1 Tax=Winogradskyella pulchriflava TaxID=1110688 RepID=A0ABV6Q5G8_9FLAO
MKKFLGLLSLFALLTAFTCENEPLDTDLSNASTTTNLDLVGAWDLQEFSVTLNSSTSFEGQTFSSDIDIASTEVDYVVEFTQSSFVTNGSYSYSTNVVFDGETISSEPQSLENVTGNGTYSTSGDEMTVDGSFFEFEFDGMDNSVLQGEQTANFEISNDGQTLTFTQIETVTETDGMTGTEIVNSVNSISVWSRQ